MAKRKARRGVELIISWLEGDEEWGVGMREREARTEASRGSRWGGGGGGGGGWEGDIWDDEDGEMALQCQGGLWDSGGVSGRFGVSARGESRAGVRCRMRIQLSNQCLVMR